jgi:hypothetical protein
VFLSALLRGERLRRGTRKGTRALGTYTQAVLVLRWFLDDTRMPDLARDNGIALSTAYGYRNVGIAVLAAHRPSLHGVLLAAKAAAMGMRGTGKHHHHGGNIQVVSAPEGWPLWTSDVRPGREHDTSAARADPDLLARITDWISDGAHAPADLGYEGKPATFTIPFKKPKDGQLTIDQQAYNAIHGALRCLGERANSLLKATYKALRRADPASPRTRPHDMTNETVTQRHATLRGKPH